MSPSRIVGYVLGTIYGLVGLAGFFVTQDVEFASREGASLMGFDVNPLHNIVHLALGVVLVGAAAAGDRVSRSTNVAVGSVLALLGLLGFFIMDTEANILALDAADNLLHIATGSVLLIAGLARAATTATTMPTETRTRTRH